MSRGGWAALPRSAVGLSAVCYCGISWSNSLTIFDFEIVNSPFLDGDAPRSTSYGVYISQLIHFPRASSYATAFNTRHKLLTQRLLKQGYLYHRLCKTFSKFYRRYYDLISRFQVGLKFLMRQGFSKPEFYGDLVYRLKKIVCSDTF